MTATVRCEAEGTPFRYEVELGPQVRRWLSDRHDVVAEEVDTGHSGVVDLVGARTALSWEDMAGLVPVPGEQRIELVDRCASGATEQELRSFTHLRWGHFRRTYLDPLVDLGVVSFDGVRYWSAGSVMDPFGEVTAVELKLRDWRGVIRQARRNFRFADASYAAMPLERIGAAAVDAAAQWGVGLLGVERCSVSVVLVSRGCRSPHVGYRRLASQRLLAAMLSPSARCAGESSAGQVRLPLG